MYVVFVPNWRKNLWCNCIFRLKSVLNLQMSVKLHFHQLVNAFIPTGKKIVEIYQKNFRRFQLVWKDWFNSKLLWFLLELKKLGWCNAFLKWDFLIHSFIEYQFSQDLLNPSQIIQKVLMNLKQIFLIE
jgi:hypothetical protein